MSAKYPEHEKLKLVSDKTQFVHDFLTFCEEKGFSLQSEAGVYKRHAELLYEFTDIDQWKLEDEKRQLLEEARGCIDNLKKDNASKKAKK
jgi:hypothetical protein